MTHDSKKYSISYIPYLISCLVFAGTVFFVLPTQAGAEYIESFQADIDVRKDSSFKVVETIDYVFTEEKHGMYRCIPLEHKDKPSSFFRERYIDIEIQSIRMDGDSVPYTVTDGSEWCAKIGDPNKTILGTHTYEISYLVSGAITYEKNGGAELYWNVNGNGWTIPIRFIEARVTSKDPILMREHACYRGVLGESASCESMNDAEGTLVFSGRNFNAGEGLTVAQAVNRTVMTYDVRERYKLGFILLLVLPILIGWIAYTVYDYKTKFKTGNTIIPQYEPYEGVKPMYAGYLFDKRLDPRDITAGIVYLAEQGYIRIKKIDKKVLFFFEVDDYEIELLKSTAELAGTFEKEVLSLIFYDSFEVGSKVALSDLRNNYTQAQENYKKILALKKALSKDLNDNGFFTGFIIERRTRKGYEALDHLKGFKDFLSVTESQRYIFHNAPERNAEHFMEFLPYAIAFGVEKQWAKTFEGITIPNPDWYDGGGSVSTFNTVSLTQSLSAFSTAFASSSGTGGSASSGGGSSGGGSGGGGGGSW
jgi:uncharacterized membrane protein